jgi:hypothetical protein
MIYRRIMQRLAHAARRPLHAGQIVVLRTYKSCFACGCIFEIRLFHVPCSRTRQPIFRRMLISDGRNVSPLSTSRPASKFELSSLPDAM